VFDRNGHVKLCNKAALQLFLVPSLSTVNRIASLSRELADALLHMQADEQLLVKTDLAGRPVKLSVRTSQVQFTVETWNIVTLQDIQQEIAQEEPKHGKRSSAYWRMKSSTPPVPSICSPAVWRKSPARITGKMLIAGIWK
jgi:hypothetical protein